MSNREVLEKAKEVFPHFFENGYTWYPLGKNGVRVRSGNGKTVFITYMDGNDWSIETPEHYAKRHKGDQKKGE